METSKYQFCYNSSDINFPQGLDILQHVVNVALGICSIRYNSKFCLTLPRNPHERLYSSCVTVFYSFCFVCASHGD